jgi:dual specificity phosphatase 12
VINFEGAREKSRYMLINANDCVLQDLSQYWHQIIAFIDNALQYGNVLVHCTMGVSRSCSAVIAYLIYKFGHTYDDAYKIVKEGRLLCSPNEGFVN